MTVNHPIPLKWMCFGMPPVKEDHRFGIHLQWFAAEDEGRTEDPTERKIRKAREEGNVAKSGEITSFLIMLFGLIALLLLSGRIMQTVMEMIGHFISLAGAEPAHSDNAVRVLAIYLIRLTLPMMIVCFIAAFLGNAAQVGFLFSTKPITPDLSRIQPNFGKWAQRSFLSSEAMFNLFKSIAKVVIIAVLAYVNIKGELPRLMSAIKMTPLRGLVLISEIAIRLMLEAAVLLLVFAIPDYFFQRAKYRESLKMSKHEMKEEYKESEGDPLIKSRLRHRMQELLASSSLRNVQEADVVITNPTHFAVAIKWDIEIMTAPKVTAKGADNIALQMRELAKRSEVPLVENKPLARALYNNVEIGDEIPEEYWDIVSLVLAEVYRLAGKAG